MKPILQCLMFGALLVTATAACGGDDSAVTNDDEIVHGVQSGPADDATVYVNAGAPCTGVLVDDSIVLTALHCVANGLAAASSACTSGATPLGDIVPASTARVFVGSSIYALTEYDVRAIVTGSSRHICNGDVAALVLATPVTGVAPRAVRTTPAYVGQSLTAVGWGTTGMGSLPDFRRRRAGIKVLDTGGGLTTHTLSDGTVRHVTSGSKEIVTGESICQGDSGGPLFDANGRVAAIVSRVQPGCVGTLAIYEDASYWRDLIALAKTK